MNNISGEGRGRSLVVGWKSADETVSEGESCGGDSAWFMGEGVEFVGEVADGAFGLNLL